MLINLPWIGRAPVAPFTAAALHRDTIALVAADQLVLLRREGPQAASQLDRTIQLSFVADRVARSPSGRFLLVGDAMRLEVWDARDARRVLDVWAKDPRRSGIVGSFASSAGRDLLVWKDEGSHLHGHDLDAQAPVFSCVASTFRFAATPLALDGHFIAPGFFQGETKDSVADMDLGQLISAPDAISDELQHKRAILDHAYRLSVGPAGEDAIVVFRDPEGDETEPLDEDDAPARYDDVWGLRGLYLRHLDGTLLERVAWNGELKSFAAVAASPTRIAAACIDGIHLVSHAGGELSSPIEARWLATSPDGAEVLVQTPDGALAML